MTCSTGASRGRHRRIHVDQVTAEYPRRARPAGNRRCVRDIGPQDRTGLISAQPAMNLEPSWFTLTERGPRGGVEMMPSKPTWSLAHSVSQYRGILRIATSICARMTMVWPSPETPVDAWMMSGGKVAKGTGSGFPSRGVGAAKRSGGAATRIEQQEFLGGYHQCLVARAERHGQHGIAQKPHPAWFPRPG